MRGSIIFASMHIGGGLGMRFVGLSVGSVAASSGSALNGLCSLIFCSHCFFFKCINFPRACERGYLPFFAGGCHRPAFFLVYWYVLLPVGLCCFHNIVFFLYICRVCSFIYEIWFTGINFHWSTVSHVRLGRLPRRNSRNCFSEYRERGAQRIKKFRKKEEVLFRSQRLHS